MSNRPSGSSVTWRISAVQPTSYRVSVALVAGAGRTRDRLADLPAPPDRDHAELAGLPAGSSSRSRTSIAVARLEDVQRQHQPGKQHGSEREQREPRVTAKRSLTCDERGRACGRAPLTAPFA